eukprot:789390_1
MVMVVHLLYLVLLFNTSGGTLDTWMCGDHATGEYIDETSLNGGTDWILMVNIPHPGYLTLDTTKCAFTVDFVEVYTESNTYFGTNWIGDQTISWLCVLAMCVCK